MARAIERKLDLPPSALDWTPERFVALVDAGKDASLKANPMLANRVLAQQAPPGDDPYEYVTRVQGLLASAGPGRIAWEHEELEGSHAFRRSWMRERGLRVADCRMVRVSGDSMTPYLQDGDIVMVNLADTAIRSGERYLIAVDSEWKIKRLHKLVDGGVEIRSDNESPRHPTERVPAEHAAQFLRVLGRVVWRGG